MPRDGQVVLARIVWPELLQGEKWGIAQVEFLGNDFCGEFVLAGRWSVCATHWTQAIGEPE